MNAAEGYSESNDLADHRNDIDRMLEAFSAAGCAWSSDAVVLDMGGGAGMHSAFLAADVGKIICSDFIDQNARFGGEFIKLLHEKFVRNGYGFPIDRIEFHTVDATRMPYCDALFDVVVSFNAFEHIPSPRHALLEALRVVKPGGLVYISFDPLWTSDSGSHFQHRVTEPWRHLLDDDDAFADAIVEAGGTAEEAAEYRSAMNRKRLAEYREVFDSVRDRTEYLVEYEWTGCVLPTHPDHPNYKRCRKAGYSEEELMTRGMTKLIRKKG